MRRSNIHLNFECKSHLSPWFQIGSPGQRLCSPLLLKRTPILHCAHCECCMLQPQLTHYHLLVMVSMVLSPLWDFCHSMYVKQKKATTQATHYASATIPGHWSDSTPCPRGQRMEAICWFPLPGRYGVNYRYRRTSGQLARLVLYKIHKRSNGTQYTSPHMSIVMILLESGCVLHEIRETFIQCSSKWECLQSFH
jgi:hypothetical protein